MKRMLMNPLQALQDLNFSLAGNISESSYLLKSGSIIACIKECSFPSGCDVVLSGTNVQGSYDYLIMLAHRLNGPFCICTYYVDKGGNGSFVLFGKYFVQSETSRDLAKKQLQFAIAEYVCWPPKFILN